MPTAFVVSERVPSFRNEFLGHRPAAAAHASRSPPLSATSMRGRRVSIRVTAAVGTRRFPSLVPTTSASGQKSKPRTGKTTSATRPFVPSENVTGTPSEWRSSSRKSVRRGPTASSVCGRRREPQGEVGVCAQTSLSCSRCGCEPIAEIGPQCVPTRLPSGLCRCLARARSSSRRLRPQASPPNSMSFSVGGCVRWVAQTRSAAADSIPNVVP